ncbi:phosphate/phosphite/phosphonate ABC transporter substrate-binding protein [Paraferrimonas sedimenticola]|uniref:histidine kinase n=1 Tax=Paraferrimonas sedimenticola TaxID=375674 RepID=A0AA37W173_9GAMM|nr:phosphate/phosphite/phosphonate ABC transporter substrate-binding protein [Paraferrimonas sedimenticola]GLP97060.1 hypothetical protein GCM10007895_23660 [Paraferrimonas sedimenticola]
MGFKGLYASFVIWAGLMMLAPISAQAQASDGQTLKVAVLANWGEVRVKQRWQPTMDYLSEQIPEYRFEVVPLSFEAMAKQLQAKQVQFVVTNPGQYLQISNQTPVSWLATMLSARHGGQSLAIGSAIWVNKSSQYYALADLKGTKILASGPQALGGYQAAIGLIAAEGFDSDKFFSNVEFTGFPLDSLLLRLQKGEVDAAVTPLCTLEEMVDRGELDRNEFRLIHDQTPSGYQCGASSELYPNWSFAASSEVPLQVSKAVTSALLRLDGDDPISRTAQNRGWTSPLTQFQVRELYQKLNIANTTPVPLLPVVWVKQYSHYLWFAFGFWLLATIYHFVLQYSFNRKSARLIASERELKRQAVMLEKLQSTAVIGEVGAGLAHELNQPIAAIVNYSSGSLKQLEQGKLEPEQANHSLEKIREQAKRAS